MGWKLRHQLEGGVGVVQIVVAELLALELARGGDAGTRIAGGIERGLLVRVLAVAQRLRPGARQGDAARKIIAGLLCEPCTDGGVVGGGAGIGVRRQAAAQRRRGGTAVGFHLRHHRGVIGGVGDHGDAFVVLGRGADQGRSADVDVLDAGGEIAAAGDGLLERVKVHHHQIDCGDTVPVHGANMLGQGAAGQDPAVHQRVQRLDPAVHDLWKAGVITDLAHLDAGIGKRPGRAAGRQDIHPAGGEESAQLLEPGLVGYGNQGAGDAGRWRFRHAVSAMRRRWTWGPARAGTRGHDGASGRGSHRPHPPAPPCTRRR